MLREDDNVLKDAVNGKVCERSCDCIAARGGSDGNDNVDGNVETRPQL